VTNESTTPDWVGPVPPREDVVRGALFALIAVPLGIIVWLLIWSLGFIASIVAFGVAFAALWLYRMGARGPISRAGAFVVTGITALTLLLAFFAGIVLDGIRGVAETSGLSWFEVAAAPQFWDFFWSVLPSALGDYTGDFLLSLLFGALGCFTLLRSAFIQAKKGAEPATTTATAEQDAGAASTASESGAENEAAPAAGPEAVRDEDAPEAR